MCGKPPKALARINIRGLHYFRIKRLPAKARNLLDISDPHSADNNCSDNADRHNSMASVSLLQKAAMEGRR